MRDRIKVGVAVVCARKRTRVSGFTLMLGMALTVSGCMAASVTPSIPRLASIQDISIVPVEAPPLLAPSVGTRPVPANVVPLLTAFPEGSLQPGGRVLASVGGIIMLIQIAAAGTPTAEPRKLEDMLTDPDTWLPTRALADEAAAQLRRGSSRTIATTTRYLRLPVGDRAATWHMENWYKPIRDWFMENDTRGRYEQSAAAGQGAILEVGLINYEWYGPHLLVQVLLKLVDPYTGQVIGRTRQYARRKVGPAEDVLADGVARFKEIFSEIARPLVGAALEQLGLIQH